MNLDEFKTEFSDLFFKYAKIELSRGIVINISEVTNKLFETYEIRKKNESS